MSTAQDYKTEGDQAYKQSNYQQAIEQYTKAIELDPQNSTYYSNRSASFLNIGKFQEALDDGLESVKINPEFQRGYERQIKALIKLTKLEDAKKLCKESIEKFPENSSLKQLDTQLQQPEGQGFDLQNMLKNPMVQQLMKENPQMVQSLMANPQLLQNPQMMNLLMQMVQKKQATGDNQQQQGNDQFTNSQFNPTQANPQQQTPEPTEEEIAQDAKNEETKQKLLEFDQLKTQAGQFYMKKQFKEALEKYEKCIELNQQNLLVRNNKAACLIELKQLDEALQVLDQACEVYNETDFESRKFEHYAKLLARKARIYHLKKDYENSIKWYEESLLEHQVKTVSASLRQVKRDKQQSEELAYINTDLSETHRQQGNDYYKLQKYPEALKEYEEALKRNPKDGKVLGNLAAVFIKLMRFNDAMKYCDQVLELDPKNIKALNRKGQIYNFRKEYHKAMDTYKLALELAPEDVTAKNGIYTTQQKIAMGMNSQTDDERVKRAMQDPEIVQIMQDPMVRIALDSMRTDPARARECMQDPNLAPKIQKLIQAGVLRMG